MRGLGSYPAISLARTRTAATATAESVKTADPERPSAPTFGKLAREYFTANRPAWSNPKHAVLWRNTLAEPSDVRALGSGEDLIFPAKDGGAMSYMVFIPLQRELKVDSVPHGFRSSSRDWEAEQSGAPWAVCESALAHSVGNSVEAGYMRSDLLEERREFM